MVGGCATADCKLIGGAKLIFQTSHFKGKRIIYEKDLGHIQTVNQLGKQLTNYISSNELELGKIKAGLDHLSNILKDKKEATS